MREPINVLSLFDGISCGQLALQRAGIPVKNYFASEIDKHAIKITQKNFPDTIQIGDVKNVKVDTMYVSSIPDSDRIDLLIGGSPCQGFSFAGKRLNFNDPRSALFFEYVRMLKEIREYSNPDVKFLLENVKMKKEYQDIISEHLGVQPIEINSALVSAQNRKRLYWTNIEGVCHPEDKSVLLKDILLELSEKELIKLTHSDEAINYMNKQVSGGRTHWDFKHHSDIENNKPSAVVANIYKGVPYNVLVVKNIHNTENYIQYDINGKGNKSQDQRAFFTDGKHGTIPSTGGDSKLKVILDRENNIIRKLHPIEAERLQTLPDNYTEGISDTQRYKAIGNGWTVDVIAHILSFL